MPPTTTPVPEEAIVDSVEAVVSPGGSTVGAVAVSHPEDGTQGLVISADEIDKTIIHPGAVRINVEGAFIVDSHPGSPTGTPCNNGRISPSHETSDIRLPNHTAVVSHIAIDVSTPPQDVPGRDPETQCADSRRVDWRLPGKARLLHHRGPQHRARRQAQLPQLRDGQDRRLPRVHEPPKQEAGAERLAAQRALRHGDGRRRVQVLRQDQGRPRRGREARGRDGVPDNR